MKEHSHSPSRSFDRTNIDDANFNSNIPLNQEDGLDYFNPGDAFKKAGLGDGINNHLSKNTDLGKKKDSDDEDDPYNDVSLDSEKPIVKKKSTNYRQ